MIGHEHIADLVDERARELASRFPDHAVSIDTLAVAVQGAIERVLGPRRDVRTYAQALDVCGALNEAFALERTRQGADCALEVPGIAERVAAERARVLRIILQTVYHALLRGPPTQKTDAPDRTAERELAELIAAWIPEAEPHLPATFGPAWLEEHALDLYREAASCVHDGARQRWEWFQALLPTRLQRRFDPGRLPFRMPPIRNKDDLGEAWAAYCLCHGLTDEELLDEGFIVELKQRDPDFRKLIERAAELAPREEFTLPSDQTPCSPGASGPAAPID
jgi:hypothetical protein